MVEFPAPASADTGLKILLLVPSGEISVMVRSWMRACVTPRLSLTSSARTSPPVTLKLSVTEPPVLSGIARLPELMVALRTAWLAKVPACVPVTSQLSARRTAASASTMP